MLGIDSAGLLVWLGIVSAALTAMGLTWTKIIRPLVRLAAWWEREVPVLDEIARQFRTNGGSSLRDEVTALQMGMAASAEQTVRLAESVTHLATVLAKMEAMR